MDSLQKMDGLRKWTSSENGRSPKMDGQKSLDRGHSNGTEISQLLESEFQQNIAYVGEYSKTDFSNIYEQNPSQDVIWKDS